MRLRLDEQGKQRINNAGNRSNTVQVQIVVQVARENLRKIATPSSKNDNSNWVKQSRGESTIFFQDQLLVRCGRGQGGCAMEARIRTSFHFFPITRLCLPLSTSAQALSSLAIIQHAIELESQASINNGSPCGCDCDSELFPFSPRN